LTFVGASLTVQHKDLGNIPGGRLQIGIMAGLKSECMADIASEQLAGFVGIRIRPRLKLINVSQSAHHRLLHQIVSLIDIAGKGNRESSHRRNRLEKVVAKVWGQGHGFPLERG
jgi:hypothetical protein